MKPFRAKPADIGRQRLREIRMQLGREVRIARVAGGISQEVLGRRAEISQEYVSAIERGEAIPSLDVACRLAAGCGHRLTVRLYPADGIHLRDSGQLRLAEVIAAEANGAWRTRLEVPVGEGRAHDLVLDSAEEVAAVEIERSLVDAQAQIRAAQRKRDALAERELRRPVRLILGLPDTAAMRRLVRDYGALLGRVFPLPSRRIWWAIHTGRPLGGDGILFIPGVRRERAPTGAGAAAHNPRFYDATVDR